MADSLDVMTALLDDESVDRAVAILAGARRIVVAGNGLSAPVAAEAAMRLTSVGHPADGSGATDTSLRVPQTLLVNALVQALVARYPEAAADARARLLEVIGGAPVEGPTAKN